MTICFYSSEFVLFSQNIFCHHLTTDGMIEAAMLFKRVHRQLLSLWTFEQRTKTRYNSFFFRNIGNLPIKWSRKFHTTLLRYELNNIRKHRFIIGTKAQFLETKANLAVFN